MCLRGWIGDITLRKPDRLLHTHGTGIVLEMASGGSNTRRGQEFKSQAGRSEFKSHAGRWTLDAGRWTLDAGRWTLDAGRWTLDAGRWTLDAGRWTLAL